MKRAGALFATIVVAAAAVAVVERLNEDRRYRQLLIKGERALTAQESYAAIEAFSGALALRPRSMVAYYRRGEAYASQGQVINAVRDLRSARELDPNAPQPLEALGRLYEQRGEAAEAARWYQEAAQLLGAADPALLYSLALAHYRAGNPAAAFEPLRQAVATDDALVRAHYLLGLVYRDARKHDEALASLQHAIRLSPSFFEAREELADLYGVLDRPAEQIAMLRALAQDDPQLPRHVALARVLTDVGRYEDALTVLATAEADAPGSPALELARGRVYLMRAESLDDESSVPLARRALEAALNGTTRRGEGLALLGRALFLAGEVTLAERTLLDATQTPPVAPVAYAYLADAAEWLDHTVVAERALRQLDALRGDTDTSDVRAARHRRLGALALDAGHPAVSIRFLTDAIGAGYADPTTLALLGRARWETGDRTGARSALAQALAQAPDDEQLHQLEEQFR